jgi:enoyl-CoA hydratase/3-hydroxyacyl-CoA dehydrogenase
MEGSRTKGRTTIEVGADGVALITIINPPVNSLSFDGITRSSVFFSLFGSN